MNYKLLSHVLIIAAFLLTATVVTAQSTRRIDLEDNVKKLNSTYREQNFDEASKYALKSLELFELEFGRISKESFNITVLLGNIYALLNEGRKSDEFYFQSYILALQHYGEDSVEMENARANYSFYQAVNTDSAEIEKNRMRLKDILGYEGGGLKKLSNPKWPKDA